MTKDLRFSPTPTTARADELGDTVVPLRPHGLTPTVVNGPRDPVGRTPHEIPRVVFDRRELSAILWVYGQHVAAGEWRDYAIDMLKDRAVFSIFRRTSECPLYTVVKMPKLARRQGAYSVVAMSGQILKRGHDLQRVLRVFDRKPELIIDDV